MRGFVTQTGCVGAELAGALEIDGLRVEGAHQRHDAVHLQELGGVPGELRQGAGGAPLRVEKLVILNLEFGDCLQTSTPHAARDYT